MPFTAGKFDEFFAQYEKSGYPLLSHSEAYRDARKPHYRVVSARYIRLLPLISAICARLEKGGNIVCALDGRAAAGKSTAAALIADAFSENGAPADVINMDDFFLPPELRTGKRLSERGGNVHYERFREEVLPNLRSGKPFSYRRFDCSKMQLGESKPLNGTRVTIVEGAYSLSDAVSLAPDISAFVTIDAKEQLERLRERDGERLLAFTDKWIPMEEAYIAFQNIEKRADIIIH